MKESMKDAHAESYPGRPLPPVCSHEEVKPTTEGVKELRDKQLGSNGMIGN